MGNRNIETNLTLSLDDLDSILSMRFLVARLGEAHRFCWWDKNLDATDFEGGGSFFRKLLPSDNHIVGQISAVEAVVLSAKEFELKKLRDAKNQKVSLSIFIAPPYLESELSDRIFHWKRFPSETPDSLKKIIDSKLEREALLDEFKNIISIDTDITTEGTSFGMKLKEKFNIDEINVRHFQNLLKAISLKKGEWSFPYYE
ncbi:BREX-6 system BrxE protein [Leptospira bandrabouensis]|uniref:BREX-6 system BrxE protein n=1 Tax=Leptospira bandrabouensis TaxID=2484903 RepID=UPI001EE938D3|nr:BREX-6 system BrxE protein [Leptospira bandrabouensis]MCG6146503.1 BREX-6 system BrxE protein [Leptospira bandrabouensis]MCG6161875.1 BREX-6 system BrxE protein [Leptospira bandrabouensis]MCG6166074.1 BREX-6 system BrxE protein [Leptospira bandrabouensis]